MERDPLVYTQIDPNTNQPAVQHEPEIAEQVVQEVEEKRDAESTQQYNMRMLRERAERAEKALAERERQEAYKSSQQHQPYQPTQPAHRNEEVKEEESFSINDDDIMEGRHIKKYSQSVAKEIKSLREELKKQQQYQQQQQAVQRIQSAMPDFQSIVNEESIKNFAAIYPEEYQSIGHIPDDYGRAKLAYTLIKSYGLNETHAPEQTRRIEENRNKPKASSASGGQSSTSPLSALGDYDRRTLSEDRKAQLRKMVAEAKRFR